MCKCNHVILSTKFLTFVTIQPSSNQFCTQYLILKVKNVNIYILISNSFKRFLTKNKYENILRVGFNIKHYIVKRLHFQSHVHLNNFLQNIQIEKSKYMNKNNTLIA